MSGRSICCPNFNKVSTRFICSAFNSFKGRYKNQVSKLGYIRIIKIFLPILCIIGCFAPNCKDNSKLLVKEKGGAATPI